MKPLTCEMCGSTNLVKKDGNFECQSCGTKYSVEEAKKMMIDGSVSIKGAVKIDKSEDVIHYLNLANTALDNNNGEEAYSYANRVLEIDSNNPDAWFIKMKATSLIAILADLRANEVINAGLKAIEYSNEELAIPVYEFYLTKLLNDLIFCSSLLFDTQDIKSLFDANCQLYPFKASELTANADEVLAVILNQVDNEIALRDAVPNNVIAPNPEITRLVVEVAKQWGYFTQSVNDRFNVYKMNISDEMIIHCREILKRIKQGLPKDTPDPINESQISNPSAGPCYIATAYYGSYDCPEVWILRRYRDNTLHKSWIGRHFITLYYAISPTLVKWFGQSKIFKKICKYPLEHLVTTLYKKGVKDTPYQDQNF